MRTCRCAHNTRAFFNRKRPRQLRFVSDQRRTNNRCILLFFSFSIILHMNQNLLWPWSLQCNVLRSAVPALDTPLALVVAEYAQTPVTELVVWAGPAPWEKVTDRPKATVAPVSRHALAAASRASSAAARRAAAEGDREKASDGKGKEKEADAEEEKKPASTYTLKQKPVEYIKNMRPPVMEVGWLSACITRVGSWWSSRLLHFEAVHFNVFFDFAAALARSRAGGLDLG